MSQEAIAEREMAPEATSLAGPVRAVQRSTLSFRDSMPRRSGQMISDVVRTTRPALQAWRAQDCWICVGGISVRDLSRSDEVIVTLMAPIVKSRFGSAALT